MTPIAQISSIDLLNRLLSSQALSRDLTGNVATRDSSMPATTQLNTKSMNQIIGHIYTAILASFILWVAHTLHEIEVSSLIRGLAILMILPVAIYLFAPGRDGQYEHGETESSRTIRQLESALQNNASLTRSGSSRKSTKTNRSRTSSALSTESNATDTKSVGFTSKSNSLVCPVQKLVHSNSMPVDRSILKSKSPARSVEQFDQPITTPSPRRPNYTGETHFQRPSFNIPRPHCPRSRSRTSVQRANTTRSFSENQARGLESDSLHSEAVSAQKMSKLKRLLSFKKGLGRRESL